MKATIYDGTTLTDYSPSDPAVLATDTPYVWVDVSADDFADPQVHALLGELGIADPVLVYLRRDDLAGTFRVVGQHVIGSTWAAADVPAAKPVYVHVVWSSGALVTLRSGGDAALAQVHDDLTARGPQLFAHPTVVPGVVLDLILDSVDRRLTAIRDELYTADEHILIGAKGDQIQTLRGIRDEVAPWQRRLPIYQVNLKEALVDTGGLPGMDADGIHYLQAYESHVGGTTAAVGDLDDSLHSAVQDYQAELSNRQGNLINQLTVVATIFLPITFITGYFGMNFTWLGDVTVSFGSWLLLGVVLPVGLLVGSVLLLRRGGFGEWLMGRRKPRRQRSSAKVAATRGAAAPSP